MSNNPNNLGNLAYYETVSSGLVPCKVTAYDGYQTVYFTVTADRGVFKRGEKLSSWPIHVIPRKMVHVRSGIYHIRQYYAWVNGTNGVYAIQTRA